MKRKKKSKRLKSLSKLKKEADKWFSFYIRKRDNNVCFTCGSKNNPQCGHFVSRRWNVLRYHEKNCHCQCSGCNIFKKGNMDEYAYRLTLKYGKDILRELNELKIIHQFTRDELENIIDKYKEVSDEK